MGNSRLLQNSSSSLLALRDEGRREGGDTRIATQTNHTPTLFNAHPPVVVHRRGDVGVFVYPCGGVFVIIIVLIAVLVIKLLDAVATHRLKHGGRLHGREGGEGEDAPK